jgi:hypothetical protein
LPVLGLELRVLHLLAGTLPLKSCPQPFLLLVVFQIGSYSCLGPALDCDPSISASKVAGIICTTVLTLCRIFVLVCFGFLGSGGSCLFVFETWSHYVTLVSLKLIT